MDLSKSTYPSQIPYPITAGIIAVVMAYGSVSRLLLARGLWDWVSCAFYATVSIGSLQLYQWARVATIAVAIMNICLIGAAFNVASAGRIRAAEKA